MESKMKKGVWGEMDNDKYDYLRDQITISLEEYSDLIYDKRFLKCLRESPLSGWEGYKATEELFRMEEGNR